MKLTGECILPKSFLVAASLLSADFSKLGEEIQAVEKAGSDWLHVDVMDGHFVPNLTIGAPVVKSLRKTSKLPFDVHLMIEKPESYIAAFAAAGADYLTIHVESTKEPLKVLKAIRELGMKPGITLRPQTDVSEIESLLGEVDLVLVMTVNPGFGGQSFIHDQIKKIQKLYEWRAKKKANYLIEVDGGINPETAKLCSAADVLVAGNYIFSNKYSEAISLLKAARS